MRRPGGRARPPRGDAGRLARLAPRRDAGLGLGEGVLEPAVARRGGDLDRERDTLGATVRDGHVSPLEPLGERARGAAAGLGEEQPEGQLPGPDRAIRLARLAPDDVADRPRDALDRGLGRTPRQPEQEDGRRPAIARVPRRLVAECRRPVLAGVEDQRASLAPGGPLVGAAAASVPR